MIASKTVNISKIKANNVNTFLNKKKNKWTKKEIKKIILNGISETVLELHLIWISSAFVIIMN